MYIKQITTSPFKGRAIALKLAKMVLIHGDNLVGKTSIPDAIKVGTVGYVPKVGKTHQSTFSLSSDPEQLNVQLEFDDGQVNYTVFTRDAEGQVSRTLNFAVQVPAEMMDFTEYLKKTEQEKMRYILACVDPSLIKYDDQALLDTLKKIEVLPTEFGNPACKAALKLVESRIKERKARTESVPEWIAAMVAELKAKARSKKGVADTKAGGIQALREQDEANKAANTDANAARIRALEAELTALDEGMKRSKQKLEGFSADLDGNLVEVANLLAECKLEIQLTSQNLAQWRDEGVSMKKHVQCPTCKSKGTGWLKSWTTFNAERIALAEAKLKVLNRAKAKNERAQAALNQMIDARDELRDLRDGMIKEQGEKQCEMAALKQRQIDANRGSKDLRDKLEREYAEATTEATVMTAFSMGFIQAQEQLVYGTFDNVLAVARSFTSEFFRAPLEYRAGDLGYERGKTWVSWKTFSGAEELFAFAGFSIALCQKSPFKIVLLDEFGRLTANMKVRMVKVLKKLIGEQVIDQCIIIDADADDYAPVAKDLKFIEVCEQPVNK